MIYTHARLLAGVQLVGGRSAVAFLTDEERAELIAALSRTAEMVGLLLDALDVLLLSRLSEEDCDDTKRDKRHSAEHHEPFEHNAVRERKRHGMAAYNARPSIRRPHITARFAAPILGRLQNGKIAQVDCANAVRRTAASTFRSRYAKRRSMRYVVRRHPQFGNGERLTLRQIQPSDLSAY
jgi:hypothetical protein